MKPAGWLTLLVLMIAGMVVGVYRRSDPNAPVELERDGSVFADARRIADEDDVEGLEAYFRRRGTSPSVVIRAAPGTGMGRLLLVLRAAHQAGGARKARVVCGKAEETLDLPPPPLSMSAPELSKATLYLCARGDIRKHCNDEGRHLRENAPGDAVSVWLERWEFPPLLMPETEAAEVIGARVRAVESKAAELAAAGARGGIVHVCPGVPVEYALLGAGALRRAAGREVLIWVVGMGDHRWKVGPR